MTQVKAKGSGASANGPIRQETRGEPRVSEGGDRAAAHHGDDAPVETLLLLRPGGQPPGAEPPSREAPPSENPPAQPPPPPEPDARISEFWKSLLRTGGDEGNQHGNPQFSPVLSGQAAAAPPRSDGTGTGLFVTLQQAETRLYELVSNVVSARPLMLEPLSGGPGRRGIGDADLLMAARPVSALLPPADLILAGNAAPAAVHDVLQGWEDEPFQLSRLLLNDTDGDGDTLRLVSVSAPGFTVTRAGGEWLLHAAPNWHGTVRLSYTVEDGHGGSAQGTAVITVGAVNDAPTAGNDTASAVEDGGPVTLSAASLLANDRDIDAGDVLSLHDVSAVSAGGAAVSISGGNVVYDPAGRFQHLGAGVTATDTFTYQVRDQHGGIGTGTVTVTVTGVNDGPVAAADAVTVAEDATSANLTAVLLANDSDVDLGDVLRIGAVNTTGTIGTVLFDAATQTLRYQADGAPFQSLGAGATATDTFRYTISDGKGGTATATATVTVTGVNDIPVASADAVAVLEDGATANLTAALLANDSDVDLGDVLRIGAVNTTGTAGTVLFSAVAQTLVYQANAAAFQSLAAGATATDTFRYTVSDGKGGTATATVTVTVTGVNDGPAAVDDGGIAVAENAVSANLAATVLANDTDVDIGDTRTITAVGTTGTQGTVIFDAGAQTLTYRADGFESLGAGATATDTFTYTITDSQGATSTATVTVTVTGVNDAPHAAADTAAVPEDGATANLTATLLANDSDIDVGDTLHISAVNTTGTQGTVLFDAVAQTLVYQANTAAFQSLAAGATATDTFQYTVSDGKGGTATATATVTVTGVNDNPVLSGLTTAITVAENTVNTTPVVIDGDVSFSDVDVADFDGGTLTVSYAAGGGAEDGLGIRHQGVLAGQIGVSGSTVTYGGVAIGAIISNGAAGAELVITFNAAATAEAIEALTENLTYRNGSNDPTPERTLAIVITDGDGGQTAAHQVTVTVTPEGDSYPLTSGSDSLTGAVGDDTFTGAAADFSASDSISGRGDLDLLHLTSGTAALDTALLPNLLGVEQVQADGNAAHSLILRDGYFATPGFSGATFWFTTGSAVGVTLDAGGVQAGHSVVFATGSGNDTIIAGLGDDRILTGGGDDEVQFATAALTAADTVDGGAGTDTLQLTGTGIIDMASLSHLAGFEVITLDGRAINTVILTEDYFTRGSGVDGGAVTIITHPANIAEVDASAVTGPGHRIVVESGETHDTIRGGAGNDWIAVGNGSNVVLAGGGADTVITGNGTDWIDLGDGDDLLMMDAASLTTADTVDGGAGIDTLRLGAGLFNHHSTSFLNLRGIERFELTGDEAHTLTFVNAYYESPGFTGNTLTVTSASAVGVAVTALAVNLAGRNLEASLGSGNDSVWGTAGADILSGGAGDDFLRGMTGADLLTGGSGADIFAFYSLYESNSATMDTITDYEAGVDRLDLSGTAVALHYMGNGPFTGISGQVRWEHSGGNTFVHVDNNGDFIADLTVRLNGIHTLTAADIIGLTATPDFLLTTSLDRFIGGAGDEVFEIGSSAIHVNDTLSGGGGIDTLRINTNSGHGLNFANYPNITGIERFVIRSNVGHSFTVTDAYFNTPGFDGNTFTIDSTTSSNITVTAGTVTSGYRFAVTTGEGNDAITVGDGDDWVSSGGGNDRVLLGLGSDYAHLGNGQDTVDFYIGGFDAGDTLYGGAGIDLLRLNSGVMAFDTATQIVRGFEQIQLNSNGAHSLTFTNAFFTDPGFTGGLLTVTTSSTIGITVDLGAVTAGAAVSVSGSSAADVLTGGSGADTMLGNNGADTLTGGAGADVFRYTAHAHSTTAAPDVITDFTSGTDRLDFTGLNFSYIGSDPFSGAGAAGQVRWVVSGSDVLVQIDTDGNATADMVIRLLNTTALTYADFIGLGGYFQLTSGNDSLIGGASVDMFAGLPANLSVLDTITGGAGNDILRFASGAGALNLNLSAHQHISGIDVFQLYTSAAHVFTIGDDYFARGGLTASTVMVNLSSSVGVRIDASSVALAVNAINAAGSNGADTLLGGAGADTLNGGAGDNVLDGGAGNDVLYANTATEWIDGGAGNDTVIVNNAASLSAADTVRGGEGIDTLRLTSGVQTFDTAVLTGVGGFERMEITASGAHVIAFNGAYFTRPGFEGQVMTVVNQLNNAITVDASAMTNAAYAFVLTGQNGAETLIGGAGADTITGGNGIDRLTGGGGADRFVFTSGTSAPASPDIITDFTSGQDVLDISNGALQLYWAGTAAFSNVAGQVRWQVSGSDVLVQVDFDGNGTADLAVRLLNTSSLSAFDVAGIGIQHTLTNGTDAITGTAGNELVIGTSATIGALDTVAGGVGLDVFRIGGTAAATVNVATWAGLSGFETFTIGTTAFVTSTITVNDAYFARPGFEGTVLTVNFASGADGSLVFNGGDITDPQYRLFITTTGRWDTITGGAGNDTINGSLNDSIRGGDGDDSITGSQYLYGENGNDTITAQAASTIDGGAGDDLINGSYLQDVITGGAGSDVIYTGSGNDLIVYTAIAESTAAASDIIMDFVPGLDVVRLVGLGFTGIQAGAASGSVLGYTFDGTYTNVRNAAGTFLIRFLGDYALNNSHFQFTAGVFNGSAGNDYIFGTSQNDTINGLDGNDTLYGGGGSDSINGGNGNDYIVSTSWSGTYNGDDGDDTIAGGRIMNGGNGNDSIIGHLTYSETITGGAGADTIETRGHLTTRDGSNGGDVILYTAISDSSTAAPDVILDFMPGSDVIGLAGLGFTGIQAGAPAGSVLGYSFDGTYTNITNADGTFLLRLLGNHAPSSSSFIFTAGVINGTAGADSIIGTAGGETIHAGDGDDTVHAGWGGGTTNLGDGDDLFWGGYGIVNGGDGNDTITPQDWGSIDGGAGEDSIVGYAGTWDTIIGGEGADLIWGGSNAGDAYVWRALTESTATQSDTIFDYTPGDLFVLAGLGFTGIQAGAASGSVLGYVFDGTHTVVSSSGSFMFKLLGNTALSSANFMFTAGVINGTAGNDLIYGTGSAGLLYNETIDGGDGHDTIMGGGYNDSIRGGNGNDSITSVGTVDGGAGNDTITASGWNNWAITVDGGDGHDSITGGAGADSLFGGTGNDMISGMNGNDTLNGGAGRDTLTGGAGSDWFVFSAHNHSHNVSGYDLITDFQNGADRFILTGLGFTSLADFETITFSGGVTTVADSQTGFGFQITGNVVSQLDNADFVF